MKKIFLSLAALMMMTAPVMTSCSSEDLDEVAPVEEAKENVVTLTIAPPAAEPETRVTMGGDKGLTIAGWEKGDEVMVYYVFNNSGDYTVILEDGVSFKCTDPSNGTFTGTLPEGKTLDSYNVAVYGHDLYNTSTNCVGFFENIVTTDLKELVYLVGEIKDGKCSMSIFNNIIKVNNIGKPVTGAWKRTESGDYVQTYCALNADLKPTPAYYFTSYANAKPITIPEGESYILMPCWEGKLGLFTEDNKTIIPLKDFGLTGSGVGKIYTCTIPILKGTAKRTGNIDVNWVQLWADGPKFAEYNVGAANNKAEDFGGLYQWGDWVNKGGYEYYKEHGTHLTGDKDAAIHYWGSNWRMPTSGELQALHANCDAEWTTVNGVAGRKFTGKGNFNTSSIFLPAAGCWYYDRSNEYTIQNKGYYWSADRVSTISSYCLKFGPDFQSVEDYDRIRDCSVRAVLAE